ncbi:hypothetical protein K491DRAFT_718898 [Lophiostoma macrostomum CBS 122681]|uniref:F-box domain-containing protein n=1 Tax=Lophiostoma macrostomum CBS 122681 TaxID=1314788 RepID=A0A6A6T0X3_9PLEO|nr:hypothetical protein K491DRAFT_718898 [Lophiostoma macrostomum CBS 122681]
MVNAKNVAFKVDKQNPSGALPSQPFATVINCRKPGGRRSEKDVGEVKSRQVPLSKVPGSAPKPKRKRKVVHDEGEDHESGSNRPQKASKPETTTSVSDILTKMPLACPSQKPQLPKPTKFRRGKAVARGPDVDCWFTILTFSDPAQLLEMRGKIALCYRFLRDHPNLWKRSRSFYYGDTLPDPPAEINEFQYADLRHGHACMSCRTPSTRKTYWSFLRRWCKSCLLAKTVKEQETANLFRDQNGEDISFLQKCLSAGSIDSWGNFIGPGPTHNPSNKTIYLRSDIETIVEEFIRESQANHATWHAEMRTWMANKTKAMEERREFASKMKDWEEVTRNSKSTQHQWKKDARRHYYIEKAKQLSPPMTVSELEGCPAYRRAVLIPKEPNMTSWLALKPKLEKEVAQARLQAAVRDCASLTSYSSSSGVSTPSTVY